MPRLAAQPQSVQQQQQEQLRIVGDPATNSLIIYGTTQEYQNIKNILKDLDAVPRQVLIEAMILQIDLKDTEDFGIDYEIFRKSRQTIFGKTFGSNAAITSLGTKLFPNAPAFGGVAGLSAIAGDDTISALIRAAATDSRIKLISSPSVIASDNRPARIQVGSEEPIATSSSSQPAGTNAGFNVTTNQIQYRNTGRILTIIPQVNAQGLVNLQIKAEVSARGEDVKIGSETFPAFNTQDAETTAVVQDGETLVIGGLIGELKRKGRSGIPYLMDIPVIGRFFGTTNDETNRTELIMLITPRVIRNRDESRQVTAEFKSGLEKVRAELERLAKDRARLLPPPMVPPMLDPNPPTLPPPAPSNVVPGRGASLAPSGGMTGPYSNYGREQPPQRAAEREAPSQPQYALSIAPVAVEPLKIAAMPANPQLAQLKKNHIWSVQVAALADKRVAQSVVAQLREAGYDAYVKSTQGERKIWHRVRVGQFDNRQTAHEERKALIVNKQFQQAYVAVN